MTVRPGRLRRTLRPLGLGIRTAAGRAWTAVRSLGGSLEEKEARTRDFHERTARRYAEALGDMRGALMKVGQVLAFVDVGAVPERYRDVYQQALGSLFADVPPLPIGLCDQIVREDLGQGVDELFAEFSSEPIAAASIGQVHEARLHDGTRVAVKVQYPGVAEAIEDDLRNTELLVTFFRLGQSIAAGLLPRADLRVVAGEIRERVTEELDYTIEARNQELFRSIYEGHPTIRIPKVFGDLSTRRVLTMEYADGRRWEDALDAPEELRQRWAETIWRFVFRSHYNFYIFNGDPHPGNYLFGDDGTVTFLDFGCVKYLDSGVTATLKRLVQAGFAGEAEAFRECVIDLGALPPDDPEDAERILEWERIWYRPNTESPFRFTRGYVAEALAQQFDMRGEWRSVLRRFDPPKDLLFLNRINTGLWSILASLGAENDWHGIHFHIWREGPPTTELGHLEEAWLARRGEAHVSEELRPKVHLTEDDELDPNLPEFRDDPYPDYARLRVGGRIHWMPPGIWMVTRYADCHALLRDERLSADPTRSDLYRSLVADVWGEGSTTDRLIRRQFLFMDPPDHTRLRALVQQAFTRRAVEGLRPRIGSIARDLVDAMCDKDVVDLMADLAYPLPVTVIAELLGVPLVDRERFEAWSRDLLGLLAVQSPSSEAVDHADATVAIFLDYFRDLVRERRDRPADDLLTALIRAEDADDRLSEDEVLATCLLLLVAGHETTANLIGNGTLALLGYPKELQRLREEPTLVPSAVEELLRYDSPVQATTRTALEDIELDGKRVSRGDRVMLLLGSANRDPDAFEEPDRLVVDREPNRHIAFGSGIHFCLGAPLARLEARIALATLIDRCPDLRLTDEGVPWKDTFPIRGPRSLMAQACR